MVIDVSFLWAVKIVTSFDIVNEETLKDTTKCGEIWPFVKDTVGPHA